MRKHERSLRNNNNNSVGIAEVSGDDPPSSTIEQQRRTTTTSTSTVTNTSLPIFTGSSPSVPTTESTPIVTTRTMGVNHSVEQQQQNHHHHHSHHSTYQEIATNISNPTDHNTRMYHRSEFFTMIHQLIQSLFDLSSISEPHSAFPMMTTTTTATTTTTSTATSNTTTTSIPNTKHIITDHHPLYSILLSLSHPTFSSPTAKVSLRSTTKTTSPKQQRGKSKKTNNSTTTTTSSPKSTSAPMDVQDYNIATTTLSELQDTKKSSSGRKKQRNSPSATATTVQPSQQQAMGDHKESVSCNDLHIYYMYLSIHCLNTLIEDFNYTTMIDNEHNNIVESMTTLPTTIIWLSYAITTQLLSKYEYSVEDECASPSSSSVNLSTSATLQQRDINDKNSTTSKTTDSKPESLSPSSNQLPSSLSSTLGRHLIGQLLLLLSQVVTKSLSMITTTATTNRNISDDDEQYQTMIEHTIFAAIVVLDYVTCIDSYHYNIGTTTPTGTTTSATTTTTTTTTTNAINETSNKATATLPSFAGSSNSLLLTTDHQEENMKLKEEKMNHWKGVIQHHYQRGTEMKSPSNSFISVWTNTILPILSSQGTLISNDTPVVITTNSNEYLHRQQGLWSGIIDCYRALHVVQGVVAASVSPMPESLYNNKKESVSSKKKKTTKTSSINTSTADTMLSSSSTFTITSSILEQLFHQLIVQRHQYESTSTSRFGSTLKASSLPFTTDIRSDSNTVSYPSIIKRWPSIGLVWYCNGQEQLLQCVYNILHTNARFSFVWDNVNRSTHLDVASAAASASNMWMIMLIRLCDIVHEIGEIAGKNPTSNPSISSNAPIGGDVAITVPSTEDSGSISSASIAIATPVFDMYLRNLSYVLTSWSTKKDVTEESIDVSRIAASLDSVVDNKKTKKKSRSRIVDISSTTADQPLFPSELSQTMSTTTINNSLTTKLHRTDICDIVVVVSYHLIHHHYRLVHHRISKLYSVSASAQYGFVINDDNVPIQTHGTSDEEISGVTSFQFNPYLITTLVELADAATTNAISFSNGSMHQSLVHKRAYSDRIKYILASFIVQAQQSYHTVIDLQLTLYAIRKLVQCADTNISGKIQHTLDALKYQQPLPKPEIPTSTDIHVQKPVVPSNRKRKKIPPVAEPLNPSATFAGMYDSAITMPSEMTKLRKIPMKYTSIFSTNSTIKTSSDSDHKLLSYVTELSSEEKLVLFIRAFDGQFVKLLLHITWIADSCCMSHTCDQQNTNTTTSPIPAIATISDVTSTTMETRKRKSAEATIIAFNVKTKRQKRFLQQAIDASGASTKYSQIEKLSGSRIKLIHDIFTTVAYIFCNDSTSSTLNHLQSTIRSGVSIDHIQNIMNVVGKVEDIIIKVWNFFESTGCTVVSAQESSNRRLWSALLNLSIGFGKAWKSIMSDKKQGDRITIYRNIAKKSQVKSDSVTAWPLWLRPSYRVYVTASLVYQEYHEQDNGAELHILKGTITELNFILSHRHLKNMVDGIPACKYIPETPLSLYDVRIFLVAFSRVSNHDQKSVLTSLLLTTENVIQISQEMVTKSNEGVFMLVGRLVTLCFNAYCVMKFGPAIREKLRTVVKDTLIDMSWPPDLSSSLGPDPCDKRFLGVFEDWESSELPSFEVPSRAPGMEAVTIILDRMLGNALRLGFLSAHIDSCYILFAAWNELGKRDLWRSITTNVNPFTTLPDDLSVIILQLRDELCYADRMIKRFYKESVHDSTLIRVINDREGDDRQSLSAYDIKRLLRNMINKVSNLVDASLCKVVKNESTDVGQNPTMFCLLQVCTVYLTFAISSLSKPKNDFFSETLKKIETRSRGRSRGYSTDSETLHRSEADSEDSNDRRFATFSRIHDVCERVGAAPAHPDWLDCNCELLESASAKEVGELALEALGCLTKIINTGLLQSQSDVGCAIGKIKTMRRRSVEDDSLARTLVLLEYYALENTDVDLGDDYRFHVQVVSGLNSAFSSTKVNDSASPIEWYPHSSHRVLGKLPGPFRTEVIKQLSVEELKLFGEWEILLSTVLNCARTNVRKKGEGHDVHYHFYEKMTTSQHWKCVCEAALSSMVPSAALLRFCLFSSRRPPHPLSFIENPVENIGSNKWYFVGLEERNQEIGSARNYNEGIISTLATMTFLSSSEKSAIIASHLTMDPEAFLTVQATVRCSYGLQALEGLNDIPTSCTKEVYSSVTFLLEKVGLLLKYWGYSQVADSENSFNNSSILTSCILGNVYGNEPRIKTIALEDVDLYEKLSRNPLATFFKRNWRASHFKSVRCILNIAFDNLLATKAETQCFFAFVAAQLFTIYYNKGPLQTNQTLEFPSDIMDVLNSMPINLVEKTLRESLSMSESSSVDYVSNAKLLESLCIILGCALHSVDNNSKKFSGAEYVYKALDESFDSLKHICCDGVLELYFLYATYFKRLDTVGAHLFNDLKLKTASSHENLKELLCFNRFVVFAEKISIPAETSTVCLPQNSNNEKGTILSNLPACCSYGINKDFHGQHWYNCYTCGLINDKGCCTLCALICHQGHDVVYARFSPFFCDCGGEEDSGCKSLQPDARDDFLKMSRHGGLQPHKNKFCTTYTNIVRTSFPSSGAEVIEKFSKDNISSMWSNFLFDLIKLCKGRRSVSENLTNCVRYELEKVDISSECTPTDAGANHGNLSDSEHYSPCSHYGRVEIGVSIGNSTTIRWSDRLQGNRTTFSRGEYTWFDVDHRGRAVLVDDNRLVFIACFSILNSICMRDKVGDRTLHTSMPLHVNNTIGFAVKGVKFIPDLENSFYAWGSDKAKVILMSHNFSTVLMEKDLCLSSINFDRGTSEIVNCLWLRGSGACIAIACSHQIFIFDVANQGSSIKPIFSTSSLTADSALRDFVVVRIDDETIASDERRWKFFVTLSNGSIQATTIVQDEKGQVSEIHPLEALKREIECTPRVALNSRYLYHFEQSNILLYEGENSAVMALFLSDNGSMKRNITLLPSRFPLTSPSSGGEVVVHGPFTFWKELVSIRRGGHDIFRIMCVAKLDQSDDDVLIVLDYSDGDIEVKEWTYKSREVYGYEKLFLGLGAFTAPMLRNESSLELISSDKNFEEKMVLCVATTDGFVEFFVEKPGQKLVPILTPSCYMDYDQNQSSVKTPRVNIIDHSVNVIAIEDFSNVTGEVVFGGHDLGSSDNIKQKVSLGTNDSFKSPHVEGCVLTISLKNIQHLKGPFDEFKIDNDQFIESNTSVITAVRILLGSMEKNLPRSIRVLGKSQDVVVGLKRWYVFQLSAQEVAFSLRTGFVSIEVDRCHDVNSHPAIDAIEVYALDRRKIQAWLPVTISFTNPFDSTDHLSNFSDRFRVCIKTWAVLKRFAGNPKPTQAEVQCLKQLVSDSVLDTDKQLVKALSSLLSFEKDEDTRLATHDTAILCGCSSFLLKVQRLIKADYRGTMMMSWHYISLIPEIRSCLRTASYVARRRPFNYPQGVKSSIAINAIDTVTACLKFSVSVELVEDFIELSLLESTVSNGTPLGSFGSFDGIRTLMQSANDQVASKIYESISRFCKFGDIFNAQTVAVRYVCDHCLQFIDDARYTMKEREQGLDLCLKCFNQAREYAENKDKKEYIKIDGKLVGESRKLTCSDVFSMEIVAIQTPLKAVSGAIQVDHSSGYECSHQNQLFNDFMDGLTTGITGLLTEEFKKAGDIPNTLVGLSVDLIRYAVKSGRKKDRGIELLSAMSHGLNLRLRSLFNERKVVECKLILEGLICTFIQSEVARNYFLSNENVVPIDPGPEAVERGCCVHKIPASNFKVTDGTEKDRVFVACPKDLKNRCNFFKWANEKTEGTKDCSSEAFDEEMGNLVWQSCIALSGSDESPLHLGLCSYVERFSDASLKQRESPSIGADNCCLQEKYNDVLQSFYDGVFCCHELLRNALSLNDFVSIFHKSQSAQPTLDFKTAHQRLLEAVLEFVSLVGSPGLSSNDRWFPILCRIASREEGQNSGKNRVQILSRRCLWQLCGKDASIAVAVRDHYGFASLHINLLQKCAKLLDLCHNLNEKARVSGSHWKHGTRLSFKDLRIRHFVGVEGLVSEDISTVVDEKSIGEVLRSIHSLAVKRGGSWRQFCGLQKLSTEASDVVVDLLHQEVPPLFVLFASFCGGCVDNQRWGLRIIRASLFRPVDYKTVVPATSTKLEVLQYNCSSPESILNITIEDVYAFIMTYVYRGRTYDIQKEALGIAKKLWQHLDKIAQCKLLNHFFPTALRNIGGMGKRATCILMMLQSMVCKVSYDNFDSCRAIATVESCLHMQRRANGFNKCNGDYFHIDSHRGSPPIKPKRYNLTACSYCHSDYSGVKVEKFEKGSSVSSSNYSESEKLRKTSVAVPWLPGQLSSYTRFRLDMGKEFATNLEFCAYITLPHRIFLSSIHVEIENPRRYVKTIKFYFTPRPVERASSLKSEDFEHFWQPCGEMNVSRGCTRTSFALPSPVVIANLKIEYADFHEKSGCSKSSDGSLIINCPRCTRVVSNAHGVCANCGEVAFQCRKCRHINYERLDAFLCVECGYCTSASFRYEVTAAVATNAIAITNDHDYEVSHNRVKAATELYEELLSTLKWKLTSLSGRDSKTHSKNLLEGILQETSDDSFIPEIGTTNSPFVDVSPKEMMKQLGSSGSMIKRLAHEVNYRNASTSLSSISLFNQTNISRSDRSSSNIGSRTAITTTGFLLRDIARDALALSSTVGYDSSTVNAASELFSGLFDSSSGDTSTSITRFASRLDSNDPLLRRISANARSRREVEGELIRNRSDSGSTASAPGGEITEGTTALRRVASAASGSLTKQTISKEDIELCDKLYSRMREVECEIYELNRRCDAWRRLNLGCLYSTLGNESDHYEVMFEPSHCSGCGPVIVVHLVLLWLALFRRDPQSFVVTNEMIVYLFDTDMMLLTQQHSSSSKSVNMSTYQNLQDVKRTVIQEIATRSEQGSKLVLEALRLRLSSPLMQDQNAAEVLGLILEAFAKVNSGTNVTTNHIDAAPTLPSQDTQSNHEILVTVNSTPFVELAHQALQGNFS